MQSFMSIDQLLNEVNRQSKVKEDYIVDTASACRMVFDGSHFLEVLRPGHDVFDRYTIADDAHGQISARLRIPRAYYSRLLVDYPQMIVDNINEILTNEPESRMFRILDGEVRAYLSDRYARIDNERVICNSLPSLLVQDSKELKVLGAHVDSSRMNLKVIATGDAWGHEVAQVRGEPRIMRPGLRMSNSEVGGGALKVEAFFYDSYCTNGCVFGSQEIHSFKRRHLGAKAPNGMLSQETINAEDAMIASQVTDVVSYVFNPKNVAAMAERLRNANSSEVVKNPIDAVSKMAKDMGVKDDEQKSMLETFIRDGDYSQFGMASAVTEVANNEDLATAKRVDELENLGGKIIDLTPTQWSKYVECVAA